MTRFVTGAWLLFALTIGIATFIVSPLINLTGSVPVGLYLEWKLPVHIASLHRDDYIVFCPTPAIERTIAAMRVQLSTDRVQGNCGNHRIPFIKKVAALPGDLVEIRPGANGFVAINAVRWANSAVSLTRVPVQRLRQRVSDGEVWALGVVPSSLDSRYFGPIPINAIRGLAIPISTQPRLTSTP